MKITVEKFQKYNPQRPPFWRASLSEHLTERYRPNGRRRPSRTAYDKHVLDYYRFLCVAQNTRLPYDIPDLELFTHFPDVYYAHQIETADDIEWRSLIRAHLLAGESFEKVAERFGTLPEAIERYAFLFFDVLDRLDHPLYIVKSIGNRDGLISQNVEDTRLVTEAKRAFVYELFGYFGGVRAVEIAVSGFGTRSHIKDGDSTEAWLEQATRAGLRRKTAIASHAFELNRYNFHEVMNTELRHQELAHLKNQTSQQRGDNQQEVLQAILEQVPVLCNPAIRAKLEPAVKKLLTSPIELRAADLFQLGDTLVAN